MITKINPRKAVMSFAFILPAVLLLISAFLIVSPVISATAATASSQSVSQNGDAGNIAIAAGIAIGVTGAGAALGLGTAASAAIAAITEKEEVFGKALIFVVLIEGVAIFGFLIALQIVPRIADALGG